ncbi:HSR1 [Candida pseudojiufengensis]|uniref:HSR1 n=1 Tax=Candida pseudojiufengensis TaxID=497109 RepID=UPI002224DE68|nr:HSR1 [Candida pseudojiufengensis]KAI5958709.1 HSR1 [Candida pseudojiufengensis]
MTKKNQGEARIKKNAFVHKLYTMLSDPTLDNLIWWSHNNPENNTFSLYPGKEFANCLTRYFKHGNVASFVRQLHMYGFHKVSDPNNNNNHNNNGGNANVSNNTALLNSMNPNYMVPNLQNGYDYSNVPNYDNNQYNNLHNSDYLEKEVPPIWEFKHSSGKFKKGDENSLIYIKRRSSSNNNSRNNSYSNENSNKNHRNNSAPSSSSSSSGFQQQQQPHLSAEYPQYPQYPPFHNEQIPHHLQHPQYDPQQFFHGQPQQQILPQQQPYPPQYQLQGAPPQMYYSQQDNQFRPPVQNQPPPVFQYGFENNQPSQIVYPQPPQTFVQNPVQNQQPQQFYQHQGGALSTGSIPHPPNQPQQIVQNVVPDQRIKTPVNYTPNLQFRKVWDDHGSRQRNPSLLFDPLAPIPQPPSSTTTTIPSSSTPPTILNLPSKSNPSIATSLVNKSKDFDSSSSPSSSLSRQSSNVQRPSNISLNSTSTSQSTVLQSPAQEFDSRKTSIVTPIVAPIPHYKKSISSTTSSNDINPAPSASPTTKIVNDNSATHSTSLPPVSAFQSQHSNTSSQTQDQQQQRPQPITRPSFSKKPSILSSSLQERLRPSVFELHAAQKGGGTSSTRNNSGSGGFFHSNSITNGGNSGSGSIGSHSSSSIFSNKSSISSMHSFQRTSSFGSIIYNNKSSISVAPHEMIEDARSGTPQSPMSISHLQNQQPQSITTTSNQSQQQQSYFSSSFQQPQLSQPPINRSKSSRPTTPIQNRSSSPLSKSIFEPSTTSNSASTTKPNKKVSVTSLLDDSIQKDNHSLSRSSSPKSVLTNSISNVVVANTKDGKSINHQPLYLSSVITEEDKNGSSSRSGSEDDIKRRKVV